MSSPIELHSLEIVLIPIAKLIPYARNARTHSDEQVAELAGLIREFGFTNPVLIGEDDTDIIAGHGRVLAGRKLDMPAVPCRRLLNLTIDQRRAVILSDNRTALNAGWDVPMLRIELGAVQAAGFEPTMLGFGVEETKGLLQMPDFGPGTPDDQSAIDEKEKTKCPECGHEFTT